MIFFEHTLIAFIIVSVTIWVEPGSSDLTSEEQKEYCRGLLKYTIFWGMKDDYVNINKCDYEVYRKFENFVLNLDAKDRDKFSNFLQRPEDDYESIKYDIVERKLCYRSEYEKKKYIYEIQKATNSVKGYNQPIIKIAKLYCDMLVQNIIDGNLMDSPDQIFCDNNIETYGIKFFHYLFDKSKKSLSSESSSKPTA